MFRKKFAIICCCATAAFGLGSCVTTTDEYNSLTDISLDMQIAPDGLSIPLGSLAKIRLDSLIKVKEDGVIKILPGGTYGITMDNTISQTSVDIDPLTISIANPVLPSKTANFGDFPVVVNIDYALESDIEINSSVSLDQTVDATLVEVSQVDLNTPSDISIKLQFENLPANADAILDAFKIPFPSFMQLSLLGNDADVSLSGSTVTINKTLSDTEKANGLEIKLQVSAMTFSPAIATTDDHKIQLSEPINVTGKLKLDCHGVLSSELNGIAVAPSVTIAPMEIKTATGKFSPQINAVKESVALSLGKDLDFLKSGNNNLVLSDPTIILDLNSTLTVPLKLDLSLSSKNSQNQYIKQNVTPDHGTITVAACPLGDTAKKTVLVLNSKRQADNGDTIYVQISQFPQLMTTIPDSICFNITPSIDNTVTQTIDLKRDLKVNGSYVVKVPLAFNSLNIEYKDTIKDLGKDLADIGENITSARVQLKGFVTSTVPMNVLISFEPYNKNGQKITDIDINSFTVPASNGSSTPTPQPILLEVKLKKAGALKDLDNIILKATCSSNSYSELKNDQYLYFTGLVLKIPEGIGVDLSDKKDKK